MKLRKLLALFLSACLIAASTSMAAFAEETVQQAAEEEQAEELQAEVIQTEDIPDEEQSKVLMEEAADETEEEQIPEESETEGKEVQDRIELTAAAEDGMTVTLKAANDAFEYAEGLYLEAEIVGDTEEVDDELEEKTESDNVAKRVTYDIRVMYDGEEIQPLDGRSVRVEFTMTDIPSGADAVNVYHHNAQTEEIETIVEKEEIIASEEQEEMTVSGITGSFSFYTVDFTYDNKTVRLEGDTEKTALSGILAEVGITEEIAEVAVYSDSEFTDECEDGTVYDGEKELFRIYEEEGIWYADAVNAFSTEHGIKVTTADGTEYRIRVTDDAVQYHEMAASEVLAMFNDSADGKVVLTENIKITTKDCDLNITRATGEFDLNGYIIDLADKALIFKDGAKWDIYDSKYCNAETTAEMGQIWCNNNAVEAKSGAVANIYGGYIHANAHFPVYPNGGRVNVIGGRYEAYYLWPSGTYVAGGKFLSNKPSDRNISGTSIPDVTGGPECRPGSSVVAVIAADGTLSGKASITAAVGENVTIVMLKDLKENITIPEGKNVILNLNGKVLDGTITVEEGGSLTLRDYVKAEDHTGDYALMPLGGVVTGGVNTSAVTNNGTFTMCEGSIVGNTAAKGAGVNNNGTFSMNGGVITGNVSDFGGGVYNNGTMNLSGKAIIYENANSTLSSANNLYLENGKTFGISGSGMAKGALIGITAYAAPPAAVSQTVAQDYSEYFESDIASYEVAYKNNVLMLQIPGQQSGPQKDSGSGSAPEEQEEAPVFTGTVGNPVTNGQWNMAPGGFWTYRTSGFFRNTWGYIANPYAKNEADRLGWFWFDKDGVMATGWRQIGGKWYFFNTDPANGTTGMLLMNAVTPDGYKVDENGAWVK